MTRVERETGLKRSKDAEILRLLFQSKWRLSILREVVIGPVRLSELRRRIPNSSKKMLIDTLHGLERLGWIERRELSARVRRVEYRLAPPCAEDIKRIVLALVP